MIVRSGNESIVRVDRERIRGYRIGGSVVFFLALANLAIGLDEAAGYSRWGNRILAFGRYAIYMVPAAILSIQVFKVGRVLSQAFVAIGPQGVTLRLLTRKVYTFVPRPEQRLTWEEIRDLTCDGRVCRFRAGSQVYKLDDDNSPSPPEVAQLMAERMGVQLPAQALAPPSKRLKQAGILGGIGIAMMGVVAAGGWWLFSHAPASYNWPYYKAEFLALLVLGFVAITLAGTAVILGLMELNHRL